MNFKSKTDLAILLLRLFIGGMFFLHGIGKPMVAGMEQVIQNFNQNNFPAWTAYLSVIIEVIAGIMLLLGWKTRYAALSLFPVSIGILIYHFPNGWVFQSQGGGYEYPQLIIISLIVLFLIDGGRYAIDKPKQANNE